MRTENIIIIIAAVFALIFFSLSGYGFAMSKHDSSENKNQDNAATTSQTTTEPKVSKEKETTPEEKNPTKDSTKPKTITQKWNSYAGAWLELENESSKAEYHDGRVLDVLNPNYYDVNENGDLILLTVEEQGPNAYSLANAIDIKKYSRQQYITISGNTVDVIRALINNPTKIETFKTTTKNMLDQIKFTGLDIDFEDFWEWNNGDYVNFKNFLTDLGNYLHHYGYKLQVDLPAFIEADDEASTPLRYADFNKLPIDRLAIMTYDYDMGNDAGYPISPFNWVKATIDYLKPQITNDSRIVMGIPSYAYKGTIGTTYGIRNQTKLQSLAEPYSNTATRDESSAEMYWTHNGKAYFYNDTYSMNAKRKIIEAKGITNVMVWVLGDNDWFTGTEPTAIRNTSSYNYQATNTATNYSKKNSSSHFKRWWSKYHHHHYSR